MAGNEKTSDKVAEIAAKGLKQPGDLTNAQIRTLAGSVLTQAPDAKKPSPKPPAPKGRPGKR